MTTKELLDRVALRDTGMTGAGIAAGLDLHCPVYDIDTHLRLAHLLAQACHETCGFKFLHEIWGPTPAQIGYEGRADLGNTEPGDGYRFRGRGIFQLTGRANYTRIGAALGIGLENDPEMAADPSTSAEIACFYWNAHNLNAAADANDILRVTRGINGGLNGLADREACFARARELLP